MNIQTITKMLIDAGIEPNEAKIEIKMLLEHFCKYTEKDRLMGREPENIEIIEKKCRKELKPEHLTISYWRSLFYGRVFQGYI